jgi:ubiquinone biosynthesis protein
VEYRLKIESEKLQEALDPFLRSYRTTQERVAAIEAGLRGESGRVWREELAKWTVRMVPVELLVPEAYAQWRPLVRDSMMFVVSRLSPSRLAPKVVEQMEARADTPPEVRLLRFIAKVPGLQKIGQVLARNRNLDARIRRALTELENGISDVSISEVRSIILREVGPQFATYAVELDPDILSEASVSAVVGFTWRNPETQRREEGVFKVLKPHIPDCYAEDMKILQQLAGFLARKYRGEGVRLSGVSETLTEIRLLLEREVDFPGEQATLSSALRAYRSIPGVRVPHLIQPLSTATVTALTRERGVKVTEAVGRPMKLRLRVAQRLTEALMAVPALTREKDMIFHADPHAGNLLYDKRRGELVILDWALTGRLTLQQRKCVFMLVLMAMLRDADGMISAIERLRLRGPAEDRQQASVIRECVTSMLDGLPLSRIPGPMDAMRVLDEVALNGMRFPAGLLMFRKAWFTLEGILEDISKSGVRMDSVIARYALAHWASTGATLFSMLSPRDLLTLDWSTLTLASRFSKQALFRSIRWAEEQVSGVRDQVSGAGVQAAGVSVSH